MSGVEFRFIDKNNNQRWISATFACRHDPLEDSWLLTAVATDISQRKQMEYQLQAGYRDLQGRVEDLTAQLAHTKHLLEQEIQQRQRAEEKLRQSEEELRLAVELARQEAPQQISFYPRLLDAVHQGVIATNLKGKIIYCNHYAEVLYPWKASEVLGDSFLPK